MSRRASLPGAAELFRTTVPAGESESSPSAHPGVGAVPAVRGEALGSVRHESSDLHELAAAANGTDPARLPDGRTRAANPRVIRSTRRVNAITERAPTGRERHEEKITVYCSAEELLDLESARLQLRAEHGMAVDRGRIVREAVAMVLADLRALGESSILVRRLREP